MSGVIECVLGWPPFIGSTRRGGGRATVTGEVVATGGSGRGASGGAAQWRHGGAHGGRGAVRGGREQWGVRGVQWRCGGGEAACSGGCGSRRASGSCLGGSWVRGTRGGASGRRGVVCWRRDGARRSGRGSAWRQGRWARAVAACSRLSPRLGLAPAVLSGSEGELVRHGWHG